MDKMQEHELSECRSPEENYGLHIRDELAQGLACDERGRKGWLPESLKSTYLSKCIPCMYLDSRYSCSVHPA